MFDAVGRSRLFLARADCILIIETREYMMVGQRKTTSFQDQAAQRIQQEALGIAKATQTPGQTKEQTKLIAKGIEKGIALYKQQQKQKAREQDKARKKLLRLKQTADGETDETKLDEPVFYAGPHLEPATVAAGCLFAAGALAHAVRYFLGLDLIIGGYAVPLIWSIPVAIALAALAAWMFISARH